MKKGKKEQTRIENGLQNSEILTACEEKYRFLFNNMSQGAFYQQADGRLFEVNQAALDMLGLTREQFEGRTSYHPDWKVIDPDGNPLPPEEHASMIALRTGKEVRNKELGVFHPGRNEFVWLIASAIPQFRPGEDQPFQVFATLHDFTHIHRQDAVRSSHLHLIEFSLKHSLDEVLEEILNEAEKLTASKIAFMHFVQDDQESLILMNWSHRTKTEFCNAEGKGQHYPISSAGVWVDCVYQKKPVIHNDFKSVPNQKGMPAGHAEVIRELVVPLFRSGKVRAILGVGNKAYDYNQADVETVSTFLDLAWEITERKRIENRLVKNESRLRELNLTKDKLFSIIAHDLKSPFNAILGFSELMAEAVEQKNLDQIVHFSEVIRNSSNRAMTLLLNLLDWSRSQRGIIPFEPEPIELFMVIMESIKLHHEAATKKSIVIQNRVPHNVTLVADRAMISTITRNLISNAIKFTNAGGKILISAGLTREEITISVTDNGIGIDKTDLDRLFRIDQGLTKLGTEREPGTGLGLILCKEFVEKHGGRIWVESSPGSGSAFRFTIPFTQHP